MPGAEIHELPEGIEGDITQTTIDCSMSWAIYFKTAQQALSERLTTKEIKESSLPVISKKHLTETELKVMRGRLF